MIIKNKYIPVKGFSAMAVYPFIFVRKDANFTQYTLNHELIHFDQQKELYFVGFWVLYLYYHLTKGYYNNPFEREAYLHQKDLNWRLNRPKYHWRLYA